MFKLSKKDFKYISRRLYDYAGINLTDKKCPLIVSRLSKRIRLLGLSGFPAYIRYLKEEGANGGEFEKMVDALSTNYSLFFREIHHFEFLQKQVFPRAAGQPLNIWSAAASTGQEIYSALMTIKEFQRKKGVYFKYKLFASDISRGALTSASRGIYMRSDVEALDRSILKRYFLSGVGDKRELVKIKNELIREVRFFKLNLNDENYNLPLMDVIFLRNVIIYFDQFTKKQLITRLYSYLKPGGYLMLGHSESLSGISDLYMPVGKTIYKRRAGDMVSCPPI